MGTEWKKSRFSTYQNARKLFNMDNNDIGMCTTGLYQLARIKADNPEFYDSGEFMVVPFPQFEDAVKLCASSLLWTLLHGELPEAKENQEMAWKFISYMLSHAEEYLEKVAIIYQQTFLNQRHSRIIHIQTSSPILKNRRLCISLRAQQRFSL